MKILTLTTTILLGFSSLSALAGTYTVKKGDTLYGIARKNGVSASSLMKMNGLGNNGIIHPGQKLNLNATKSANKPKAPTKKASSSSKKTSSTSRYTVQKGDTFYSISRRQNMSVKSLQALNPSVRADRLSTGMTLVLNGSAKSSTASTPKKSTPKPAVKSSSSNKPVSKPKSISTPKAPAIATSPIPKKEVPVSKPQYTSAPADLEVSASQSNSIMQMAPKVSNRPYIEPDIDLESSSKPEGSMISESGEPDTISTVLIKEEVSYSTFASRYGSSTTQLNELNGLSLKPSTTLAKGSELYVPGSR